MAAFEIQQADNPGFQAVIADDFLPVTMQLAPVAHQCAPVFGETDFPVGIDAILKRHRKESERVRKKAERLWRYYKMATRK